jgi:hypothetical protein
VFITSKGDDGNKKATDPRASASKDPQAARAQDNPPPTTNASNDDQPQIHGGPRPTLPAILEDRPAEDFVTPADKIMYDTLADPINPDYIKDVTDLDKKRRDVLKEAKRIEKLGKKLDDDITKAQDTLKRARSLEEKYVNFFEGNNAGDP